LRVREIAPRCAGAGAFGSKSIISGENAKTEVTAEGGKEDNGPGADTARKSTTSRDPSKGETAGRTAAIVRGALLLIPVEEEDSPHRVANLKREEGTRSSCLPNANSLPRVMSPLMGGGRDNKEEMIAEDRLLAWERRNHANPCTGGPCF
jgi:hypothetical protein